MAAAACKCLNRGQCDDKGKCTCPEGVRGNHCQYVVCTHPWVKKNKVCECQTRLDGPYCREVCNCLNHGQCTEDGTCNCRKGFHGDKCQHTFQTNCLGTDKAVYTWTALASLPCYPQLDEASCQKKANYTNAHYMCRRRGYNLVDFHAFTILTLGVRYCMEALLNEMIASSYSSPITIWTSYKRKGQYTIYKQGKNDLREELHDSHGTSHHDVICEAKWVHINDSVYAAATTAITTIITEQFAEEACQQYGLHLITEDWLQTHHSVLFREPWLKKLAILHKPRNAPFHVKPIRVNGRSLYRTVKFRQPKSLIYQNTTSTTRALILCVKFCESGVLAPNLTCMCNHTTSYGEYCEKACKCLNQGQCDDKGKCTCPEGVRGNHCQYVVCTHPWVKKNKVCECQTRLDGPYCREVCNCLNHGQCTEDGTCNCRKGFHGDKCQHTFQTNCLGTDKAVYTWTALASLPCYPQLDEASCQKKANYTNAHYMCRRRGYNLVDFHAFTILTLGVRYCMEALLNEMIASSYSSPITIWTSYKRKGQYTIYKQGKNDLREELHDRHGTSHHDVICEAKWVHINDSVYAAATTAITTIITEQFAEEACQQYGLHLITEDWLQTHHSVLFREPWLKKLAILHKPRNAPFHVKPIRVNGRSLYRTVKFRQPKSLIYQNTTSTTRALILCVKFCESGVLAPNLTCMCNRTTSYGEYCEKACKCLNQGQCDDKGKCTCPEGVRGNHCQYVVCTHPWVKKNKVQDIIDDLLDPDDALPEEQRTPNDNEYLKCKRILDAHFAAPANPTYERHVFRQLVPQAEESTAHFCSRLRQQARLCSFENTRQTNEAVRDQIVATVRNVDLKKKLLSEPSLSVDRALELCRVWEDAQSQSQMMTSRAVSAGAGASESASDHAVSAVTYRRGQHQGKARGQGRHHPAAGTRVSCYSCGRKGHKSGDASCPAKGQACRKCGKTGHFAKCCKSGSASQTAAHHVREVTDYEVSDSFRVGQVSAGKPTSNMLITTVQINGTPLDLEVDTGSMYTLVPQDVWEQHWTHVALRECSVRLKTYNGSVLPIVGEADVDVRYRKRHRHGLIPKAMTWQSYPCDFDDILRKVDACER
ncbi:uncharacterized protein LOC135821790 [Sycon ciliatum]|uniref:uncharacterized protein LOC135821790 n=1 Tax=Sycon ciliatum TaxID=27933 RepID=UPI0031F61056